ncbi:hypothetical protein N3K66_003670 [Trichothecium roseum]|uniref:Uncharacterized protein n=1 Tax=Trichothecium roseum TaxID=47278 RepID=A0ACC0V641_9HYPO|nr:hypothetical protein N3K66_003670 [Trichothecium roseum]
MRNFPRRVKPTATRGGSSGLGGVGSGSNGNVGICLSCRRRRAFATAAPPAKPPSAGIAPLRSRGLISVAGPDAVKFLQGIVTNTVAAKDGTQRKEGFYAGFLTATGRVVHDIFMYPDPSGLGTEGKPEENAFLVEADAEQIDTLARYIKRYKLRAKVNVRKVQPDQVTVWQAWDESASELALPPQTTTPPGILLKDTRAPGLGFRVLQQGTGAPPVDLETVDEDAYTIRRYLRGVPEGQGEIIKEQALPQESNMDFMGGIDFHKGCYVGQELTIRTRHRGVVRKRVLPCVIYQKHQSPPSQLIYDPTPADPENPVTADMIPQGTSVGRYQKKGRSAGKWLGGVGNVGLGLCRLEIMTDVAMPGETAQAAFQPDHEFVLEWAEEGEGSESNGAKVKAFVPDWLRQDLEASAQR